MKKLFLSIVAFALIGVNAYAVTASVNLAAAGAAGAATNVPTLKGGGANVLQFTLTSASDNTAKVIIRDATGTNNFYTVAAYSNVVTYATNYITTWTNFYGATNSITNYALVDVQGTVDAATVAWPIIYTLTAPTNSTVVYSVNQKFNYGILVTNSLGGACTLQMQYVQ